MLSLTPTLIWIFAQVAPAPMAAVSPAPCPVARDCRADPPPAYRGGEWLRRRSRFVARLGEPRHRGRDLLLVAGEPQWVIGKFAYGGIDKDLKGERVDVFAQIGCAGRWTALGHGRTSAKDGAHPTVDGVVDTGGVLYFRVPPAHTLPVGVHRLRLVVAGDGSATDAYVQVLPRGARVVISDIDGTLTTSANAEIEALVRGRGSPVRPGAAAVLQRLARQGYALYYLSSRPDWLAPRSRDWLAAHGFPLGTVHTSLSKVGELKVDPVALKRGAIERLKARGLVPVIAFGDKATDAQAFAEAGVPHRYFIDLSGDPHGGARFDAWSALGTDGALGAVRCP